MGHITDLPTELLVSVFLALREDASTQWLRVLLVCRRWYEVACASPALWTRLAFNERRSRQVFGEFLRRSARLPLDISLDVQHEDCDAVFDIVRPCASHLRFLSVKFLPSQIDSLQGYLQDPEFSQSIVSLVLHCLASEAPRLLLWPTSLPALRSLRAIQVLPRPCQALFNSVTFFDLIQLWHVVHSEEGVAQYDLLTTLGDFPGVERLILRDTLPPCMSFADVQMEPISLLSMRAMEMYETIEDIQLFLHHVTLPSSARLTVVARVAESMWEPDVGGVFLAILPENREQTLPMVSRATALRLLAGHTEQGALTLSGGVDVPTLGTRPAWSLVLPDCGDILAVSVDTALEELALIVPATSLVHLELHVAPHILLFETDWRAVLAPFVRVRRLLVGSQWTAEGAVSALYRHANILPELEFLELCLGELPVVSRHVPLPPPNANVPPRRIERVVIVQRDPVQEPFVEGTLVGSMLRAGRYDFKLSRCSACHVRERLVDDGGRPAYDDDLELEEDEVSS
ncbi:hypothetical protein C8Q70DRAFT_453692 [Cubamyces menziesii]|nr:hypothetical protein C8Q70DRAFT_453692 [Cubamyces menziesii]